MDDGVRKIYMFMSLSLDGYFEGPNHGISWHRVDDEVNEFATKQLKETDLQVALLLQELTQSVVFWSIAR